MQLAQCWFPGLAIFNAKHKYTFQIKYSNSTLGIYQVAIYSKQAYICDFFPEFLQVVLLTSSYLDATLRIGCSEDREEEIKYTDAILSNSTRYSVTVMA